MATIFNTLADRQVFTFTPKLAFLSSGTCTQAMAEVVTPGQTFKFQANSGPEITITLDGGYVNFYGLRDDIQSQISDPGAPYEGTASVSQEDGSMLMFTDGYNEFIKISEVSAQLHSETGLMNGERSVGLESESLTVHPSEKLLLLGSRVFMLPLDGLSDLLSIPRGANSLSFYCTTNVGTDGYGDPVYDGSDPEIYMYVGWTNGVDGYVADGYAHELCINTHNKYQETSGVSSTGFTKLSPTKFALGHNAIGIQSATPGIDIPVGATGCYIWLTLANSDVSRYPPSVTIAAISGTR